MTLSTNVQAIDTPKLFKMLDTNNISGFPIRL